MVDLTEEERAAITATMKRMADIAKSQTHAALAGSEIPF